MYLDIDGAVLIARFSFSSARFILTFDFDRSLSRQKSGHWNRNSKFPRGTGRQFAVARFGIIGLEEFLVGMACVAY